jgi:hypothetical protein
MPNNSTVQRIRCYPMIQDRCALVVKPRLAFWDWVNDHNQYQLAVRPKGNEGRVYLINDRNPRRWIEKNWLRVFEDEMATWCRDLSVWPERTRAQFEAWFTYDDYLVVYDTGTKAPRRMHYEPRVVGPNSREHGPNRPVIEP